MKWVKDKKRSEKFNTGTRTVSKTEYETVDGRFATEKSYCQNRGGLLHSEITVDCWNLRDRKTGKLYKNYGTFRMVKIKAQRIVEQEEKEV